MLNIEYVYYITESLLSILHVLVVEINEDHPKEKKQFIQSLLWQGRQSPTRVLAELKCRQSEKAL